MATNILMPALSPTMEEGKLSKWLVKEGDAVKSGDILAEIETDKATMEFEAVDEGKIGKILVPEGTEGVKVNAPIATLIGEDEKADAEPDISSAMASIKDAVAAESKPASTSRSPLEGEPKSQSDFGGGSADANKKPLPEAPKGASTLPQGEGKKERVFASPLARRIAEQKGVDLSGIAGSGPRGRIVKADVDGASFGTRTLAAPQDDAGAKASGTKPSERHPEVPAQPASKGDGLAVNAASGCARVLQAGRLRRNPARLDAQGDRAEAHLFEDVDPRISI
ncbi:MAG: biotin/lipoyl-containing protein [Rhizomicrobium sp.]